MFNHHNIVLTTCSVIVIKSAHTWQEVRNDKHVNE